MKELTVDTVAELTDKIDGFVELELGRRVPFICALITDDGHVGLFTNRRSNVEIIAVLETCLETVRANAEDSPAWNSTKWQSRG